MFLLIILSLGLVHCQHAPEPTAAADPTRNAPQETQSEPVSNEPHAPTSRKMLAQLDRKPAFAALSLLVRQSWFSLPGSSDRCAQSYDYFPGGGIYSFYCHTMVIKNFQPLEEALQMPIFLSGPHQLGELNRTSETSFGHYNPEFVQTLTQWAAPALKDDNFRRATQEIYNDYVQPLARIMWATYSKLRNNPDFWRQEQAYLQAYMTRKGSPNYSVENYFFFMHPDFIPNASHDNPFWPSQGFDAGYDGNVTKSAVGFWVRRAIDGTADDFAHALEQLLIVYDPGTLREAEDLAAR